MRLEGGPLTADLEDFLPDYRLAFEGTGPEAGGFYYTLNKTTELNQQFGDLLNEIKDLEVIALSRSFFHLNYAAT